MSNEKENEKTNTLKKLYNREILFPACKEASGEPVFNFTLLWELRLKYLNPRLRGLLKGFISDKLTSFVHNKIVLYIGRS